MQEVGMLVHCVTPANRSRYVAFLDDMFRQRARLFAGILGWKALRVIDGMERDDVDQAEGVSYLVTIDDLGHVVGSVRMAPASGPHLMGGVLKAFAERPYDMTNETWEITRLMPIAIEDAPNKILLRGLISAAMQEFGLRHGVKRLIAVTDEDRLGAAARNGWRSEMLSGLVATDEGKRAAGVMYHVSREAWLGSIHGFKLNGPVTIELPPSVSDAVLTRAEAGFWSSLAELPVERRTAETITALLQAGSMETSTAAA
jgi:N-acyl-L-homoserine lactone synthetase